MESNTAPEVVTTETKDLIVVKQLPEIVEQLHTIKAELEAEIALVVAMPCNLDTVGEIKKKRAALNARFKEFEERRKAVKQAILTPYDAFNKVYEDCVAMPFGSADDTLKRQIATVEDAIKDGKRKEVESYFNELCAAGGIDFLRFEQANIRVGLSDTETALKKSAKQFVENVQTDMKLIDTQEHAAEIMVEYKDCLNAASAILKVNNRHKALEAEKERIAQTRAAEQSPMIQKVEAVIAESAPEVKPVQPAATVDPERKWVDLRIYGTIQQFSDLKKFLVERGMTYAQHQ
jgi:hypothetical protein